MRDPEKGAFAHDTSFARGSCHAPETRGFAGRARCRPAGASGGISAPRRRPSRGPLVRRRVRPRRRPGRRRGPRPPRLAPHPGPRVVAESRHPGPRVRLVPVPVHAVGCGGRASAGVHVLADPGRGRDLPRRRPRRRDGRVPAPVRQGHAPGAPVRASGVAHERRGPACSRRARLQRGSAARRPHGRALSRHRVGRVLGTDDVRIAARPRGRGDLLAGPLRALRVPSRPAAARVPAFFPSDGRRGGLRRLLVVALVALRRLPVVRLPGELRARLRALGAVHALFSLLLRPCGPAVDARRSRDPARRPRRDVCPAASRRPLRHPAGLLRDGDRERLPHRAGARAQAAPARSARPHDPRGLRADFSRDAPRHGAGPGLHPVGREDALRGPRLPRVRRAVPLGRGGPHGAPAGWPPRRTR